MAFLKREYYVYGLYKFDSSLFYIGKGCNGRIDEHRKEAQRKIHKPGPKSLKIGIILQLWKSGLDFKEKIIENNLTENLAYDLEKSLIVAHGRIDLGTGCLANLTDGGDGPNGAMVSSETRKKQSECKKGKNHPNYGKELPQVTRDRIAKANRGKKRTEEQRRQSSKVRKGKTYEEIYGERAKEIVTKIAEGNKGHIMTEENKQKLIEANTGRKATPETIEKLRQSHKGQRPWMQGRHHKEETKEKIRAKLKGRKLPLETCKKISNSRMGHIVTEETCKRISKAKKGYIVTEETKEKIRKTAKGRPTSDWYRQAQELRN